MNRKKLGNILLSALLLCALTALFIPRTATARPGFKPSCCVGAGQVAKHSTDCPEKPSPPADNHKLPCCHACALGLGLLLIAPPEFVFHVGGEASLDPLATYGRSLPHPPPVPPPRISLA